MCYIGPDVRIKLLFQRKVLTHPGGRGGGEWAKPPPLHAGLISISVDLLKNTFTHT